MNYQQIDAERIRKVKQVRNQIGNNSGSQGYSQAALSALAKGQYSNLRNKSDSNDIPKLNGMSPVSVHVNHVQKDDSAIDTNRARRAYEKTIDYKPVGRSLSDKDADYLYNIFDANRLTLGLHGTKPIAHQIKNDMWHDTDDWEEKYGKSVDEIVDDYAKDFDKISARKDKEYGEKHPVLATIKRIVQGATAVPALDLMSTITNTVAPDSELSGAYKSAARAQATQKEQEKEGVTSNMGNVGKTAYDVGTNVAERVLQYANPSKLKYLLTLGRTAEDTRQSLEDRGIDDTSLGARAQALGAGAVDAALDVYGLDKISGLKALQESGNIVKTLLGSAAIGGGEQALTGIINEAIDRIVNGQDSIYSQNMQNYLAMGMNEENARDAALTDEVKSIIQQAGQGALFGAAMGGGKQIVGKAADIGSQAIRKGANAVSDAIESRIPASDGTVYFDGERFITKDNDGFIVDDASGSYKVDNIDQAIRLVDDMKKGNIPSLQEPRVEANPTDVIRETGIPEVDNAIRQAEEAAAEVDRLRQQIPEVEEPKQEVKQEVKQESKDYRIETVNRKGGKKGYYVAEFEDTTSKNAEPGKIYKTEAEALEALNRIKGEGETSTAKVADKIEKATTPEQKRETELAKGAIDAERIGLEPTPEQAKARKNVVERADAANKAEAETIKAEQPKQETKTVAESAPENPKTTKKVPKVEKADTENPRYKAPLEGKALEKAKKTIADNKASIEAEKGAIKLTEGEKSNYWRGNLKKAVQADIAARKERIKKLEAENAAIRKEIKGGITPDKELIDKDLHDNIYNAMKKSGSIYKDINYATKFAGDSPEAKNLAKELRTAIDDYIENPTTDGKEIREHFDKIITKAIQLDELARKNNAEYAHIQHNEYFGQNETGDQYGLAEAILMNKSLDKIRDFHQSLSDQAQANETPEEPPKPSVPKVEATQQPKQSVPQVGNTTPPPKKPVTNTQPTGPETSISKRYETLKNSDLFKKSKENMKMLETAKEKGVFNKDIEYRAKAQTEALDEYVKDPEKAIENNLNKQWDSGKDVDTSMLILHDALDSKSQAYTNLVLLKQAQQAKKAGRQLRAYRDYAGTKEHTLQKAGQYLNDKADDILSSKKQREKIEKAAQGVTEGNVKTLAEKFGMDEASVKSIKDALGNGATKEDIAKMIAMYQATGKTGVSPEALKKVKEIYEKIEKENLKPNSKARAKLEADAFKVLADDIGGKRTLKEQWDAWRYLAMLGNPKTHLRNILGNTTHRMVTEAKDNVGAVLEEAADKISKKAGGNGIERTKSLLNAKKDAGLINKAAQDADDVAYGALNDMGNKYNVKTEIDRARNSFNNKLLSKIDDLNSNALDVEDYSALKKKYSRSLARYLKANGADESIFDATDDASIKLLDKAREYAIDQAKQATFHEYSKMAESLSKLSKDWSSSDKLRHKASAWMLEGLVPFKKTPINILKQGAKYSPISLAKAVGTTIDAIRTGNSTASDAIENLASGLTGTGIMALGAFLAHEGFLTGSKDKNYDVDNAETEQGAQNYALKIGNKSYTLDWLAPMSLPLFVGVEAYNTYKDKKDIGAEFGINDFVNAITAIGEPVTEMSMLQGVNDALKTLSYDPAGAIGGLASTTLTGYVTQGVPTLAGQFSRAIDETRRSTYSDKTGSEKQIDKQITKTKNKIPFLSKLSEPYVDASGKEQKNENIFSGVLGDNFGTRLADQMLSPGYYKKGTVTAEDKELNRLYKETGKSVYKNMSSGEVGDKQLSKKDYTKYQELYGSNTDKLYKAIINSDEYKKLDDAEKVKALKDAKETSKMIADHEIGGKELKKSEQKTYDLYKEKGIDGLISDFKESEKEKQEKATQKAQKVEEAGGEKKYAEAEKKAEALDMSVDTYLKKEEEYKGGAEQYAEDHKEAKTYDLETDTYNKIVDKAGDNADKVLKAVPGLKRNGLGRANVYYQFADALKEIPSLTSGEFVRQYNEINVDGGKGISQKELLTYLDNKGYDEKEANQMWNAYGGWTNKAGQKKKIKKGKDGKWTSYY